MWSQTTNFKPRAVALACAAVLAGCGGGGGGSSDGGLVQAVTFNFPGGQTVALPPAVATTKLVATASGGGAVTFSSNTPDTCSVSGDTLSLLKAGECKVTASQAGGNGYAPASISQIFVVPKIPETLIFRNPGWQPLDANPVQLAATSSGGRPTSFKSKTPDVCTVSGTTLTKVANGMCIVTGKADGGDYYQDVSLDRNIPIGTAQAAPITFLSGYKDGDDSKEGLIGHPGNQWWCDSCDRQVSSDGTSYTFTSTLDHVPTSADLFRASFVMFAKGVTSDSVVNSGWDYYRSGFKPPFVGVGIDAQAALKFNLAQNPEWFGSANNAVNVELVLEHMNPAQVDKYGNACAVTLKATVTPTTAAATDYSVGLKDKFAIGDSCGLTGLDPWNELQDYMIGAIKFSAAAPNGQVANGSGKYVTQFKLTGPITFQ